jgi:hypothetical protein
MWLSGGGMIGTVLRMATLGKSGLSEPRFSVFAKGALGQNFQLCTDECFAIKKLIVVSTGA